MSDFHAWHLPACPVTDTFPLHEAHGAAVLAPVLSPATVATIAARARAAGEALRARSTDDVVSAIDLVARRFLDPDDPIRRAALDWLPVVSGYGARMSELVLDRMAADWRAAPLRRLLRAELRDPRALERFVPHAPGRLARAVPPRLALHVLAGNVPGVGVTSLVRGLLVRAPALCKMAREEPLLPTLFARALHQADAALGEALAVCWWPGGDEAIERAALEAADLVVHYGGADAIADLRRRAPAGLRLLDHGPRISFALVGREAAGRAATSAAAARAVATFDQQGCVSPQVVYVEQGGRTGPERFAARLAEQLGRLATELPRGRLSAAEAAAVQQFRAAAEFRAIAGEDVHVWAGDALAWTVACDPDPAPVASCLNRFVWVKPLAALEDVVALLDGYRAVLQTVAIAARPTRVRSLADALALAGCTRITTLDAMPFPTATWHHDGRGPLRELLRWTDLELPLK